MQFLGTPFSRNSLSQKIYFLGKRPLKKIYQKDEWIIWQKIYFLCFSTVQIVHHKEE
jgi:hypothetical protein